ncbi:MAG: hypothetical protein JJU13_10590 [Balneolaceae bacterium]|nr:hypothetical protein [Balneolaceae bacterium]
MILKQNFLNLIFLIFFALASLLFTKAEPAFSQSDNTIYLKMDYLKVHADTTPRQYLEIELGEWRRIHEQRIRLGVTTAWYLYKVFPGTAAPDGDPDYDFITISVYENRQLVDDERNTEAIYQAYPGIDLQELYDRADEVRIFAGSDLWLQKAVKSPYTDGKPVSEFITVNYFDTRNGSGKHIELETEIWTDIHHERIRREILNSGSLLLLENPENINRSYDYGTIDYYDSLFHLQEPLSAELIQSAHPDMTEDDVEKMFERTGEARVSHKSQLWRLVDSLHRDSLDD